MFTSFTRILRFAFQNFARNLSLSLVTITIIVLTLFSISILFLVNYVADSAIRTVEQRVDLTIYLRKDASTDTQELLKEDLAHIPHVSEVSTISPEEALLKFRERRAGDPVALKALQELQDNPLGATLVVHLKDPSGTQTVLAALATPAYQGIIESTEDINRQQGIIDRLSSLAQRVRRIGFVVSGVLVVIAMLVIFNTIKMAIYTYREEIAIMKLVGASNALVRGPFLVESVLYGLVGTAVSLGLLFYPLLGILSPFLENFFEGYASGILPYFHENFWRVLGLQLAVAVLLGLVSSSLAIRRYLRV